jgi:hypothetical protein
MTAHDSGTAKSMRNVEQAILPALSLTLIPLAKGEGNFAFHIAFGPSVFQNPEP